MKVSKRTVAREWLLFLALLPLGMAISYYQDYSFDAQRAFDAFWNQWFGLREPWESPTSTFLWFAPYLCVLFLRSIWWSIKTLAAPRSHSGHD